MRRAQDQHWRQEFVEWWNRRIRNQEPPTNYLENRLEQDVALEAWQAACEMLGRRERLSEMTTSIRCVGVESFYKVLVEDIGEQTWYLVEPDLSVWRNEDTLAELSGEDADRYSRVLYKWLKEHGRLL